MVNALAEVEAALGPVCNGTLCDCDPVYHTLIAYLEALGTEKAAELIVEGDGGE